MSLILSGTGALTLPVGSLLSSSPAQFDISAKLATTASVKANGHSFTSGNGLAVSAPNTAVPASSIGSWGQFTGGGASMVLPLLSTVPLGSTFTVLGGAFSGTVLGSGSDQFIGTTGVSASSSAVWAGQCVTFTSNGSGVGWSITSSGFGSVAFSALVSMNGYQKTPSGIIFQWGAGSVASFGGTTIAFPIAFPNGCLNLVVSDQASSQASVEPMGGQAIDSATFQAWYKNVPAGTFYWSAIGY